MTSKTIERPRSEPASQSCAQCIQTGIGTGSIIYTSDGEIPVEYLSAGDRIITRDAGLVPLRGITSHRIYTPAVAIKAGSLGHRRPLQNAIVPAAQLMLVRDWRAQSLLGKKQAIVKAGQLVDGEFITDLGFRDLYVFQLHFDRTHVIYTDGMELPLPSLKAALWQAA